MPDAVDMDNRTVAAAVRVARFAAKTNQPVTSCPYTGGKPADAALRHVWLSTYLRIRPPKAGSVSYDIEPAETKTSESASDGHAVNLTENGQLLT